MKDKDELTRAEEKPVTSTIILVLLTMIVALLLYGFATGLMCDPVAGGSGPLPGLL